MISVKVEGLDESKKRFNLIRDRMKKPNTVMEMCAIKGWRDVIDHFNKAEGPKGSWKPVSRTRKKDKGSQKPLNDTGRLRMSNRWRVRDQEAHVFNNTIYAATHNYGDTRKAWGKVTVTYPRREFMWLSGKVIDDILKTMKKYFFRK
jgi:phage gpG-like protein